MSRADTLSRAEGRLEREVHSASTRAQIERMTDPTVKLLRKATRLLIVIVENADAMPLSPARLSEENVFSRPKASHAKTYKKAGTGVPPQEYTIVEMVEDLRTAIKSNDIEEVRSLYYPLARIFKY